MLGAEFAGTVAAAPPGSPYKRGDRVLGSAQGAYGERVVAKPVDVLPLPDTLSFDQGAGASLWKSNVDDLRALNRRDMRRAVHNVPDELRGARGTRETASRYARAYIICRISRHLCTGEWLLVLAAAGGVGMAAIQVGKGAVCPDASHICPKVEPSTRHVQRSALA